MWSQCSWIRVGMVTLVAFVGLFSTVRFHVFPQIGCPRGHIVTLATFVWPLTNFHQYHRSFCIVIVFHFISFHLFICSAYNVSNIHIISSCIHSCIFQLTFKFLQPSLTSFQLTSIFLQLGLKVLQLTSIFANSCWMFSPAAWPRLCRACK